MAIAGGACPHCGAPVEFRAGASMSLVCKHCKHVVVRTDRDLRNLGRVADVVFSDAGLAVGDRGNFRGRSFSVEGRLVLGHPQGGRWEEYYVIFEDGAPAWISEAQGAWQVVGRVDAAAPPLQSLAPQARVQLGDGSVFVVQERSVGTFLAAEGELPYVAPPGTQRTFVDLSGENGTWASIDYGDGSTPPQLHLGVQATFAEFQIQRHGGVRPGAEVQTKTITCGNCGAPLPVLAPGSERAACRHCGAVSDVELQQVVARQQKAREAPSITLGARGVLKCRDARGVEGAEWVVLGYMERSTGAPGSDDWFGWQEYLLYNTLHGYRWLVFDDGKFSLVAPLAAGEVDASAAQQGFVRVGQASYRWRNGQLSRVDHVLGEFYWKVEVGEVVRADDFVNGPHIVSCERSNTEVNWSMGAVIPTYLVVQAFGYQPKQSVYGTGNSLPRAELLKLVFYLAILTAFILLATCASSEEDDSSTSGGVRSGVVGGFGGK